MSNGDATPNAPIQETKTRLRSADGGLGAKHERLSRILDYLVANTGIKADGELEVRNPKDLRWRPLLATTFGIRFPDGTDLNEWDTEALVWESFVALRRQPSAFSVPSWIQECDRRFDEMCSPGIQPYSVYTTVSLGQEATDWLIGIPYKFTCLTSASSDFPIPPCLLEPRSHKQLSRLTALRHVPIVMQVPAYTANEAVHRAIVALSIWRGLICLYADRREWAMTFTGGERKPLAIADAGPIFLASDSQGSVVDQYWYESLCVDERDLFTPKKEDHHRLALMRQAVSQADSLTYWSEVQSLLVRYADALAHADYGMAVVYLWGVLETLVGGRNDDHKIITKRAVALDVPRQEQDFFKDVLDLVRLSRNRLVHAGKRPYSEEQIAYLLKPVVDRHLRYVIRNPNGYAQLGDHRRAMARESGTESTKHRPDCNCRTAPMA